MMLLKDSLSKATVVLSVGLILCLFPWPYGYYVLVRFFAFVVFGCWAYRFYERRQGVLAVTAGALALLFQPFFKVVLGREVWHVVDVAVAIALVVLLIREKSRTDKRE